MGEGSRPSLITGSGLSLVVEYELFLAALRRPALAQSPTAPSRSAAAVSGLMAGLIFQGLAGTTPPDHALLADA
ncbi:hypothetical protein ACFZDJ_51020 [Streptomyces sp. NPDC007896]|uniref:hypothetical protein n=1 Tax=Streptomyces sp. NPDC007896 TaxID=3364784 RepID=UPI0036F1836E